MSLPRPAHTCKHKRDSPFHFSTLEISFRNEILRSVDEQSALNFYDQTCLKSIEFCEIEKRGNVSNECLMLHYFLVMFPNDFMLSFFYTSC